jgi:hypothetical protein
MRARPVSPVAPAARGARPRVGVVKFSSCDGCQLTLLDLEDELLAGRDRYGRVCLLIGARRAEELLFRDEVERWASSGELEVGVTVEVAAQ